MILIAAAVALAVLVSDPLTARIEDANAASQALQGPLDGAWALANAAGKILYTFEITDPPGSTGSAKGVWRDDKDSYGRAEFTSIGAGRIRLTIDGLASSTTVVTEMARGVWRGPLPGRGLVVLTHGLATPRPPV